MSIQAHLRLWRLCLLALLFAAPASTGSAREALYVRLAPAQELGIWPEQARKLQLDSRPPLSPQQRDRLAGRLLQQEPSKAQALLDRVSRWRRVEGEPTALAQLALAPASWGLELVEPVHDYRIAAIPDDPLLPNQPYLDLIHAPGAYDLGQAGNREIVVGIVDGGTDWRHVDLRDNIAESLLEIDGNGLDDDGNGFVDDVRGWNFANSSNDPTGLVATPNNGRHGTHIAGIVAAVSDNGVGIAGVSWNARILPVNVGTDDPALDGSVPYGFEGLIYAAASGADIVNASWGRSSGRWSDFESDVMELLEAAGILVVAAAGNQIIERPYYPAYYPTVLSVTRVGLDRKHHFSANRDGWIDLAAPGSRILSTWPGDAYELMDGTSQAAAVTSGVAALLASVRPEFVTPAQLRAQLRWSSSELYDVNPQLLRQIGVGLVDAEGALSTDPPGIEIDQLRLLGAEEPTLPDRGELLGLYFDLRNRLSASGALTLTLFADHPSLTPLRTTLNIGGMQSGQLLSVQPGLLLWADDNAPTSQTGQLTIEVATKTRRVHQAFTVEAVPGQIVIDAGDLHFTHTNNGRLGYLQPLRARDPGGRGIGTGIPTTLVQFGSLLVGLDETRVADAMIAPLDPSLYRDFRPPFSGELRQEAGVARSRYSDALALPRVGVRVEQSTHLAVDSDLLIGVYDLEPALADWQEARAGLLVDFEMWRYGAEEADVIQWLPEQRMMTAHSESWDSPYLGVALLEAPGAAGWSWLRDLRNDSPDGRPYIFDVQDLDFRTTDAQLWDLLGRHDGETPSESGGVAGVLHCGPFDTKVGESARMVVGWVIAANLPELQAAAERARFAWSFLSAGEPLPRSSQLSLLPNAPNPFNPRTMIRLTLDREQAIRISIYDSRGRRVRNLLNRTLLSGYHEFPWDGRDDQGDVLSSGVYQVLLDGRAQSARQSVVLLR